MRKKYYGQLNIHLKDLLTLDIRKTKYIEMQIDLRMLTNTVYKFLHSTKVFCGTKPTNHLGGKSANKKESLLKPSMEQRK